MSDNLIVNILAVLIILVIVAIPFVIILLAPPAVVAVTGGICMFLVGKVIIEKDMKNW